MLFLGLYFWKLDLQMSFEGPNLQAPTGVALSMEYEI
jgi:hypothetical protein